MIQLEVFGESATMAAVAESLERLDGVSRVRAVSATRPGHVLVAGLVRPSASRPAPGRAATVSGVPESGITLSRVEAVGQMVGGAAETTLVWADVLERRLAPRAPDRPLLRADAGRRGHRRPTASSSATRS